jgi:hypothetical protein
MNTPRNFAAAILLLSVAPMLSAKNKQTVEHAPLPAKVLTAKTVFIQNDSSYADLADKAYTQLKAWGRFQVVDAKEKADLILVLTSASTQTQGSGSEWMSMCNFQTGACAGGSVPSSKTNTWNFSRVKLIDASTGDTAWADQMVWGAKYSATVELVKALRQRIEEQERQNQSSMNTR